MMLMQVFDPDIVLALSASGQAGNPLVQLIPFALVLAIFLPPLLYSAAFFSNLRELRNDARAISLLAIGLVLAVLSKGRSCGQSSS